VYLASGQTITVGDYIDEITGYLTVAFADASVNRIVANCADADIADYALSKFASSPSGSDIWHNQ
jgi:hypothetical protein